MNGPRSAALALLALLALLAACVRMPVIAASEIPVSAEPAFDPLTFFDGRLAGEGRLDTIVAATVPVRVESSGRVVDGVLFLDQMIHQHGQPPRTRQWVLRKVAPGRYAGTLSDAQGMIAAEAKGNRLYLTFRVQGGHPAEQWLTLSPDGRRAYNELTVRRWGVPVAKLAEEIRKLD